MNKMLRLMLMAGLGVVLVAMPRLRAADEGGKEKSGEATDAGEVKVAIKDLPKAVVDAVNKAQPGGTLVEADKETKKGKTVYEVDVTNNGKKYEVKVDETGNVLSNKIDDEEDEKAPAAGNREKSEKKK